MKSHSRYVLELRKLFGLPPQDCTLIVGRDSIGDLVDRRQRLPQNDRIRIVPQGGRKLQVVTDRDCVRMRSVGPAPPFG
jgi:hypothetical protein